MAVLTDKLIFTSLERIMAFNPDGTCEFIIDELTGTSISNTEEKTPILGKGGATIKNLKKNKKVVITGTNGVVSAGLLAASSGDVVQNGADNQGVKKTVKTPDIIRVEVADEATIAHKPVGTVGNELEVFIQMGDGSLGKKFTQNATAGPGQFTFDPATKKIQFSNGEVPVGTSLVAIYDRAIMSKVVTNPADKYSKTLSCYIDAIASDQCDALYRVQIVIPRADFSGNNTIALGDVVTQDFEIESLPIMGNCGGTNIGQGNLWEIIIFNDDAEDAA